jgi:hypothetical protein
MMATRRGPAVGSVTGSASYTTGIDATMLFFKSITITSYYALTSTPDQRGDNVTGSSYRGRFEFNADRYGALAEHMLIDADFRPEVGYVRRSDIRRSFGQVRFSPRPRRSKSIRKFTWQGSFDYVTDAPAIEVQSKEASGLFRIAVERSFSAEYSHQFADRLPAPLIVRRGYSYDQPRVVLAGHSAGCRGAERLDRLAGAAQRRLVLRTMELIPFAVEPA